MISVPYSPSPNPSHQGRGVFVQSLNIIGHNFFLDRINKIDMMINYPVNPSGILKNGILSYFAMQE